MHTPLDIPHLRRRTLITHAAALAALNTLAVVRNGQAGTAGHTVRLAQLQQAVAQRFPLRFPVGGLMNLDLLTPQLATLPEQNRLRAEMAVNAAGPALNRLHQGAMTLDFALRYEASDRTVRAHALRLGALRFPSLPAQALALLNTYAPPLAERAWREVVLHQLRPQDLALADAVGLQPGPITVTPDGLFVSLVPKPL